MDLDVKKIMSVLLNTQKTYVLEDLEDYGCAMVAVFTETGQSYIQFPKVEDEGGKIAEYSAVVERAKLEHATLIVTVNHARVGNQGTEDWIEDYRWGDYDETNSRPCILLTASGPDVDTCSLSLGYDIEHGQVTFDDEPEFLNRVELNMLPGWPGKAAAAN